MTVTLWLLAWLALDAAFLWCWWRFMNFVEG